MYGRLGYLIPALTAAAALVTVTAPPAAADCNYSGGSSLCSSTGTVRGGSAPAPTFDPYPCSYNDPLCAYYDDWDPQIYIDLPPIRPGQPGGGGGGGGGGPIIGGGGRPGRG
ncbi:hypothetical protein [Mycolicibacterium komossense]|uniref:Keratin associated protein n=1 Tax=Mycolicibacterium komossense TaxID=1779 RepID=A0ABT3CLV7_9MYCO|nr:hypothetical protein [Mycolicibacterium komossense]MCV7230469.1 hypothetical protein [Mycolicibacterium komossense]